MTDMTTNKPAAGRLHKAPVTEYRVYFTIIFLLALLPALLGWLRAIFTGNTARIHGGVIEYARNEAANITPLIFSA